MDIQYNDKDWLVWEQNCAPFFLVMTLNPSFKDLHDYFGANLFTTLIDFGYDDYGNYEGKWILRISEGNALGQKMTDFLLCNEHRKHFDLAYIKANKKLINKAEKIYRSDLYNKSDKELLIEYKELLDLFYNFYKYGAFVEPLQWYTEIELKKCAEVNSFDLPSFLKSVSALSEDSFAFLILKDLYKCVKKFKKAALNETAIMNSFIACESIDNIIGAIKGSSSVYAIELSNELDSFCEKYYWQKNNYFATYTYSWKDLISEIINQPERTIDQLGDTLKSKIDAIEEEKVLNIREKNNFLKSINLYYSKIVETAVLAASLSDLRKQTVMKSNASFDRLLQVISKRTGVELSKIHLLLPQEIESFIETPELFTDIINDREKAFFIIQSDYSMIDEDSKNEYSDMCEEDEVKIHIMNQPYYKQGEDNVKMLLQEIDSKYNLLAESLEDSMISGTVTYKGDCDTIKGVAHVIKDAKSEIIEENEILIAPSTTPDYMGSILKCSAIITDWGGQTSHAAIVSREFRKPCIIGTHNASTKISTGDYVELNLNNGTITVLKK